MISVYDAINTVNRCEKTEKEKKKERLQECVKNCIEIVDRLILQEAEKGNEEIIITFLSFKKEDFDNKILYDTFVGSDFHRDILSALKKHYRKKHFVSCVITKPYPVHPTAIEIHWEKNPVKRLINTYDFIPGIFPLVALLLLLIWFTW